MKRIAARQDNGIKFSQAGRNTTLTSNRAPWAIVASFVFAPALMLTELRTITVVIGSPPISPETRFPIPWDHSSRLGFEVRRCGSSLSVASRFNNVSSDATAAIVTPARYTAGFDQCEESGDGRSRKSPPKLSDTGTCTR